ncbi:phosphoglucosamine mutase [Phosphitispora fastidiosa]|uniref:phosphoglucosamine mutase n=1 Tax=Phosphitispora fastidiosa TaxID=2837202 RepID=UPI001E2CB990|nr:phosphoglucosamine mutase [Phosphitispora fastidiosa]MBU7006885.1 phosphoglucosamine mutase [Phosphitispora fastidiosa]
MRELFGTDGVRGVANRDLTPELAYKIGRAGAYTLTRNAKRPVKPAVVIGKDTRISGDMLEAALIAGICSVGVDVLRVGVMPTPAIAFLTRELKAAAGVVISASHNPVEDNGIKFFAATGYKLPDEVEIEIERLIREGIPETNRPVGSEIGSVREIADAGDRYVRFAASTVDCSLEGLRIVIDCANGAASVLSPRIFRELGAEVIPVYSDPDGININKDCGSTHPAVVAGKVAEYGADLGLAHDGDADRVIAVDEEGSIVDGDHIMVICGTHLKRKGKLSQDTVVVTVMSNLGLRLGLKNENIRVLETQVGDRYVMEELLKCGATFGGEQSGHIIFLEHNTTGDGIVTGLQLAAVVRETGKTLSELAAQMERLPQVLVNVRVRDKAAAMEAPEVTAAIRRGEEVLGDTGRILVRPSGTEPKVRVMAEGPDEKQLEEIVEGIAVIISRVAG